MDEHGEGPRLGVAAVVLAARAGVRFDGELSRKIGLRVLESDSPTSVSTLRLRGHW